MSRETEIANLLERLAAEATPGPWKWWMSDEPPFVVCNDAEVDIGVKAKAATDAILICEMRRLLPEIITALRARPEVRATVPYPVIMALKVLLNHVEPGWDNCRTVIQLWLDEADARHDMNYGPEKP